MSDGNRDKTATAPATAVLAVDLDFHEVHPQLFPTGAHARERYAGEPDLRERHARFNASLQAGYFVLAVRAVGLAAGPMAGFDAAGVDGEFFAVLHLAVDRRDQPRRAGRHALEALSACLAAAHLRAGGERHSEELPRCSGVGGVRDHARLPTRPGRQRRDHHLAELFTVCVHKRRRSYSCGYPAQMHQRLMAQPGSR